MLELLNTRIVMSCPCCVDSIGIRILWLILGVVSGVASERSIFSKNHDYIRCKRVFRVAVNTYTYAPILRGLDVCGGRKHTHTQ